MPFNSFPRTVARCLGLSSAEETSPPPSRTGTMATSLTGTLNRTPSLRGPGAVSHAAAQASTDIPTDVRMTMAADWRAAGRGPRADASAALSLPIRLWGYDDPAPDWGPSMRESAQHWADRYGVNTATLMRAGGECTRYGLLELGGCRFIVGPTATPAEVRSLTRMLKAHPQIGAIFSVEPGTMRLRDMQDAQDATGATGARGAARVSQGAVATPGYRERPVSDYITALTRRGAKARHPAASGALSAHGNLDGGLSHVHFMEFTGMERFDAKIDGATLWRAGKGVADFMRRNPGKIALVCSEHGIARPCAVIASAALQLRAGDTRLRAQLATEVVSQRAEASDHHINVAARGMDLVAELSRLTAMLRAPGRGDPRWERKVLQLRQRLPEVMVNADIDWQSAQGRCKLAGILEANFERVAPLLASGGLPPGTALLWLRGEIGVLSGVRFLSPGYIGGHTDRISQDEVDPQSPDAVRLVSLDDYGLTCDNKYYDVKSVADWYRHCRQRGDVMTNPISRSPVVALLVQADETARLAAGFRH
ncbi:hypothetical protein [Pandoraea anhela]|uniref:Uncharacterized protein n=1 Tax=Pandoraea anhela TaxID=2508295 RepID=A0A5E4T6J7_9BURK|nr:hypothetical protein [Pandoraea anhela]VVD81659.1 hypothetical protein PAN31108_01137 [Pandoraea anhela]